MTIPEQTASTGTRPYGNRSERRFIVDQPVFVSGEGEREHAYKARIGDVSRRGMRLVLEGQAAIPDNVQIVWNGRQVRGRVRYRRERGQQSHAGVELVDSWDSLVPDILGQQVEDLRQSNMALRNQAASLRASEEEWVAAAAVLRHQNRELAGALDVASRVSEIKSRFLASMSHEFRTPLNGIIGFSELLYDGVVGPVTPDQVDCLSDILGCSSHLLTLINQVLDLTRIEAGKMDFHYEEIRLETVAREVLEGVKIIAAGKRIRLRFIGGEGVGTVIADAVRLRQVLFNYVSNALKHTPEGGCVTVSADLEPGDSFRVQVEDTGPGIKPDELSLLFTEFGQLGTAGKAESGTGLGLAITRRIVEAQGGRVGVESTVGAGSRFWAILPCNPEA